MEKLFYKETDGRWYIDLPEYEGSKEELEMVAGADSFLEVLAEGEDKVMLLLSETPFSGSDVLVRLDTEEIDIGSMYELNSYRGVTFNHILWLCPVTLFVFGKYPHFIHFSKINL
jgi:hypothetical protein